MIVVSEVRGWVRGWRVRGWKGVRSEGVVKVAHLHLIGCGMKERGGE